MIKQVVTTLKMVPITEGVAIHYVGQHLDEQRRLFNATEAMDHAAKGMLDELERMTAALATLRSGPVTD
jgi:hypothetical protein